MFEFRLCVWLGPALLLAVADCLPAADPRADVLLADFEGEDYGSWTPEGTAFGQKPARGALPGQMAVGGFQGHGLVNSFLGGDDAVGRLTSPEFVIARRHINFLIGGGKYPGQACLNLVVDGKVVRTATGPNDAPGGSEQLEWESWDVADLAGRRATLQIVDERQGGWGHINVDHIVQSDQPRGSAPAERDLVVVERYLHIPVKNGARKVRLKIMTPAAPQVPARVLREFDVELAEGDPDFHVFCDLQEFRGQALKVVVDRLPLGSQGLQELRLASAVPFQREMYGERDRPQIHFTSRRGWLNDPNGLVYAGGQWHLFYQHNPYGWGWGNMHWGHAVSRDLFHWQELPIALYPQRYDDWCFSGSAVVDERNTSGWKRGAQELIVAAYTSTGRGECIVYSTDGGVQWTEFEGNPVVRHAGRDPKLLWHAPSRRWVMAVYDEFEGQQWIAFYTSPDLKAWELQSRIAGFFECPDLFELPRPDKSGSTWVLSAADGKYRLGNFDGRVFTPETDKLQLWHGNFYAAQTYEHAPAGRRVQIGWGQGVEFRGMPFNQQMVLPVELSLQNRGPGVRLAATPVRELAELETDVRQWEDVPLVAGENPCATVTGTQLRVTADISLGVAESVGFQVRGVNVVYDVRKRQLICRHVTAPLSPVDGTIALDIIADCGSLEIFGNRGAVALSVAGVLATDERSVATEVTGRGAKFKSLRIARLKSIWP